MKSFINSLMIFVTGFAIAKTMSGVLVNHVIEHFGLVGAAQGYMNSMINIGTTVAIITAIAIRWKSKKTSMLVFSGIITVAMMVLTGLSDTFLILLIVSLALGVVLGWIDTYANSTIVDVNREESAKNQSAMQGFYGVGAIIAPIVVSALLLKNSWQGVYMILAPVILITVFILMFSIKAAGKEAFNSSIEAPRFTGKEILEFLKGKRSLMLLIICMMYYVMQYGLFAWLVRYMNVQYGAEALGMTSITVMWVCTAIARFVAPRLPIDNIKLHSYGSLIAGATLIIGVFSGNPWVMCVMIGIGALTTGSSLPTLFNRTAVTYEGNSLLPTSAILLSMQVTGTIVPPVLGAISVYSMQGSMVVLIVAIFISGLLGFSYMRMK